MCRWIAYRGRTIPLEHYVTEPAHSLVSQSIKALESTASTNGDGFGLGLSALTLGTAFTHASRTNRVNTMPLLAPNRLFLVSSVAAVCLYPLTSSKQCSVVLLQLSHIASSSRLVIALGCCCGGEISAEEASCAFTVRLVDDPVCLSASLAVFSYAGMH